MCKQNFMLKNVSKNNTFKTCLLSNYLRSRQNTFMTVQRKQSNLFFFEVDQWILLLKIQQLFKPDNDYPFLYVFLSNSISK